MKVLRSRRIVLADRVHDGAVVIQGEQITDVLPAGDVPIYADSVDYGDLVVMPGLVDTHVHVNEPGRTEWEGFETATRAAAAGGTTTIVDMPLNSIPATTTPAAFQEKLDAARGRCYVDTGFWGGLVPENRAVLAALVRQGVLGFKCFLVPSGVDDFGHVTIDEIAESLDLLASLGVPLLVHAELPDRIDHATRVVQNSGADPNEYDSYLRCRPAESEHAAISGLIRIASTHRAHIHVVHLASAQAIPLIRLARLRDITVTAETCPHYLYFAAEDIPAGATQFKCAPPIRERTHQEMLWDALETGDIGMIVSDHSPSPPEQKQGDFLQAWGGIASLQLRLPIVWTKARKRSVRFPDLARWLCSGPARLAGLHRHKGAIAPGMDADLVVWDPDRQFTVDGSSLHHRHPMTPYNNHRLHGAVHATWLRGQLISDGGAILRHPHGNLILRSI